MATDVPQPGTTAYAQLVRELVERHEHERSRSGRDWAVCQICGRLADARGWAGHMARSMSPAGTHCRDHGSQEETAVAAYEHPDRYCEVCAAIRDPDGPGPRRLCSACAPVWRDAPSELFTALKHLRDVARNSNRRRELGTLLRLVEHPHPRLVPLTAERVRHLNARRRVARRRIELLFLREPAMVEVDGLTTGSPEALARIAELEQLLREDPDGERVGRHEREDQLGLMPHVRRDA